MIANLAWYFWAAIGLVVLSNLGMLALGYRMGANKGDKPEPEQGDPHERPGSWGRP